MSRRIFHYEIEDRPLRAFQGVLQMRGWCLAQAESHPPEVRLVAGDVPILRCIRVPREDVRGKFAAPESARDCGFIIESHVPPGTYFVRLEASLDGKLWHVLKRLSLVATPAPLWASIEQPAPDKPVQVSTRIMGWCAHEHYKISEVRLHYSNKKVPCDYALARQDVSRLLPSSPNASHAGFITTKNIPVGFGKLRVRALAQSGEVLIAHTQHRIDVDVDEDNLKPVHLRNEAASLGPALRPLAPALPITTASPSLRILFILYGDFTSNSAIHVVSLAEHLQAQGHHCTVAVPQHKETALYFRSNCFRAITFEQALTETEARYEIIHAWTTRENIRGFWGALPSRSTARLIIHLEDHEQRILEMTLGCSSHELLSLPSSELDRLVPPTLSHPRYSHQFLQEANGVTVILDKLQEHVPAGKPVQVIWPAARTDAFFPRPRPLAFRRALGWDNDHITLFYHGNVHASNAAEVRELYAAVIDLNRRGHPCTLIRLGRDTTDFLGPMAQAAAPHVLSIGIVAQHHHIAPLMALADYFVQPGVPDAFNDYRFPSKLPEFFSIGRPVILPRTNLGCSTIHGVDAYVLDRADANTISGAIIELQGNEILRDKLSKGAPAFAARYFDWRRSAETLANFYHTVLGHHASARS